MASIWISWGEPFRRKNETCVEAVCRCGAVVVVRLEHGVPRSSGCRACFFKRQTKHGHALWRRTSKTYTNWQQMLARCTDENVVQYQDYGGRGIKVCERWRHSFPNFLADMGERPDGHSLDRIDNEGNYEPGNCRWATRTEQNRNSRRNVLLTHNGETMPISAWAERLGVDDKPIRFRIRRGWSTERALTEPVRDMPNFRKTITHDGVSLTHSQWGERVGLAGGVISKRLRIGWSIEKTLTTPSRKRPRPAA